MTYTEVEQADWLMQEDPELAILSQEASQLWEEAEQIEREADRLPLVHLTLLK